MGRLDGEVAIVTGSTSGLGRATAEMFAREGAKVLVTGRSIERGREVEQGILAAGGVASFVRADVEQEDDVVNAIAEAVRRFGKLTVLVNNAAPTDLLSKGTLDGPITELTTERWERVMHGTLTSVFWGCKYAIPSMISAGHGSIVNISSLTSTRATGGLDAYTAAKAAINGLGRSIALEYGSSNIRCNTIVPGLVVPEDQDELRAPLIKAITRHQILQTGRPIDVAYAATYLASPESKFVTGVLLPVDGGISCCMKMDTGELMRDTDSQTSEGS